MKGRIVIIVLVILIGWGIIDFSPAQTEDTNAKDELELSSENLILLFSIAVLILIGIIIYMAREIILKKKTKYDDISLDSKKNRDYEKYHSDWHDDSYQPGEEYKKRVDEEFQEAVEESSLPNYYNILGIEPNASQEEIKKRFRELVKELHPDRSKDKATEGKMAEINKAYEVLSDIDRREKYDRYLNVS